MFQEQFFDAVFWQESHPDHQLLPRLQTDKEPFETIPASGQLR